MEGLPSAAELSRVAPSAAEYSLINSAGLYITRRVTVILLAELSRLARLFDSGLLVAPSRECVKGALKGSKGNEADIAYVVKPGID